MPGKRGSGPASKRRPESQRTIQSVEQDRDSDEDQDNQFSGQTDDEKRKVRKRIRDMYEKLKNNKDKFASGTDNEGISAIMNEANDVLKEVKGTHEAMEDAKMFRLLCQLVREMSEDTNTNEKKFHVDEYAANIGRSINASTDKGNIVKTTKRQLITMGQRLNCKFRRTPSFSFILGAIDTEAGEDKPARQRERRVDRQRTMAPTKTAIVERSQADGQMTDKLVTSTKRILEQHYKQNGKKPVNYFRFVIDPHSFGNTVENMFHVSFLVKQRLVQLSVDDTIGLPVLEPVSARSGVADGDGDSVKNQAIISISFADWEELKEALDITDATIVHDEELRKAVMKKS